MAGEDIVLKEAMKSADIRIEKKSTVRMEKTYFKSGELVKSDPTEEDTIDIHQFVTQPAGVSVDYSRKFNMGHFESLGIRISVYVPCYKEELDGCKAFAAKFVSEKMAEETDDIIKLRGSEKPPEKE